MFLPTPVKKRNAHEREGLANVKLNFNVQAVNMVNSLMLEEEHGYLFHNPVYKLSFTSMSI